MTDVRGDITLSTGTVVRHARMANGAQEAIADREGGEMTPAEWEEYCQVIVRVAGHGWQDISHVTEYGLTQRLSQAVRVF